MTDEEISPHLEDKLQGDNLRSPTKEFITERTSSVSDFINTFEKRPDLKSYSSDVSFERRSSLANGEIEVRSSNKSNAISRHNSVVPSSESLFQSSFSISKQSEPKVSSLRKTVALNNLNSSTTLEVAEIAAMNQMDLSTINDIDINQIPGYSKIPENIPQWKKYQLERKNKEAISDYLEAKQRDEIERRKYGDIPQWKKDLLIKKERQLIEQNSPADPDEKRFGNIPQWKKELLKKKELASEK